MVHADNNFLLVNLAQCCLFASAFLKGASFLSGDKRRPDFHQFLIGVQIFSRLCQRKQFG